MPVKVKIDEQLYEEAKKAHAEGRLREWLSEAIDKFDINYALSDFTVQEVGQHMKVVRVYIGQREDHYSDTYDCYFIDVVNFLHNTSSLPIIQCYLLQWSSAQDEQDTVELEDYHESDFEGEEEILAALIALERVKELAEFEKEYDGRF